MDTRGGGQMRERALQGIHHVTAIAGEPQENVDFYVGVLGLRLVKSSVNQDDPGTYHLFYADAVASPGTDLTLIAWPGALPGRADTGRVTGPGSGRDNPPHRLAHTQRRAAAAVVAADQRTGHTHQRHHRPVLVPFDLLPRARRRAL